MSTSSDLRKQREQQNLLAAIDRANGRLSGASLAKIALMQRGKATELAQARERRQHRGSR